MLTIEDLPVLQPSADPLPENIVNTVETVQFCVFCFTIPFYICVIYFIIDAQSRKVPGFSSPFYKLFLSGSGIDILSLLTNYLGSMIPKWGWGRNAYLFLDAFYSRTYFYVVWSVAFNQTTCAAVLTANRLSAILFPHKYNTMWVSKNLHIAIAVQYLPGMLFSILTFFNGNKLYKNKTNGIVPQFLNDTLTKCYFVSGGVYLMFVCIFLIASYCYLFIVIRQRGKHQVKMSHNDESLKKAKSSARTRDLKLFIMSSTIVIIELLLLTLVLNSIFDFVKISSDAFYLIYGVICDVHSSINPYLLWIFSDSLRDYILKKIGLKKGKKSTISAVFSTINLSRKSFGN